MEKNKFEIERNNKFFRGYEYTPDKWNKKILIISNGYLTTMEFWEKAHVHWVKEFCKLGYKVIRYDYLGYGISDGEITDGYVTEHIKDTKLVIDKFDNEETTSIILMGTSMGALISKQISDNNYNSKISKNIFLSPGLQLKNIFANESRFREIVISVLKDKFTQEYEDMVREDALRYVPFAREWLFEGETLVIHGDHDELIPHELIIDVVKDVPKAKIKIIKDMTHNLVYHKKGITWLSKTIKIQTELIENVIDFLED